MQFPIHLSHHNIIIFTIYKELPAIHLFTIFKCLGFSQSYLSYLSQNMDDSEYLEPMVS